MDMLFRLKVPRGISSMEPAVQAYQRRVYVGIVSISALSWFMFALTWGVYSGVNSNLHKLTVRVYDLDQGDAAVGHSIVGSAVRSAIAREVAVGHRTGWDVVEAQQANLEEWQAIQVAQSEVLEQRAFAGIVVSRNATTAAYEALTSEDASVGYDAGSAINWYCEEARNRETLNQHVLPHVTRVLHAALASASRELMEVLLSNNSGVNVSTATCTPLPLPSTPPLPSERRLHASNLLWHTGHNLRPLDHPVAAVPTSSGGIYQIIFTYFVILFLRAAFSDDLAQQLTCGSEIATRLVVPAVGYAWISLSFSLISPSFGVPFDRWAGKGGWWMYWLLNWVTQMAVGYSLELAGLLGGPIILVFALLTTVAVNSVVVFIDLEMMPSVYRYAMGMPLWNQVQASKYLIFGTRNRLAVNFAVCLAWVVVSMVGIALTVMVKRRAYEKQRRKTVM